MTYTVLVGTDAIGEFPMLLHDDEVPHPGEHLRFRLVGQTEDFNEAARMVVTETRRIWDDPARVVDWDAIERRPRRIAF